MAEVQRTSQVRNVEVVDGDAVPARTSADGRIVARRIVWYIAGVIIALLALRFVLFALGANRDSGFVDFIYSISAVFAAPFSGIFPAPTYGQFFFDTASLVAMLVYALIAWGIARLFTLNAPRADVV